MQRLCAVCVRVCVCALSMNELKSNDLKMCILIVSSVFVHVYVGRNTLTGNTQDMEALI